MARSIISVLHQTEHFQDALGDLGHGRIVITGQGRLQVQIVHIALIHLQVLVVQENLPRIAFMRIPDNTILVAFQLGDQTGPVWAGIKVPADELIVISGGENVHSRTEGASHWCAIWFPLLEFMRFYRAVNGGIASLAGAVCTWRPSSSARTTLLELLAAATRAARTQSVAITMDQAVHGLEQQLVHCIMESLEGPPTNVESPTSHRLRTLANSFEALLQSQPEGSLSMADITGALRVSNHTLHKSCELHLGVSPLSYLRLTRMHAARCALENSGPQALRVSDLAARYGFRSPGRFAMAYRELFGELPSCTLMIKRRGKRRSNSRTMGLGVQSSH